MKLSDVLLEDFDKYTGNSNDETISLKKIYLESAEQVVEEYLGYSPIEKEYTEYYSGNDLEYLFLSSKPVSNITSIEIDGNNIDVAHFYIDKDYILYAKDNIVFTKGTQNIKVIYTAGYELSSDLVGEDLIITDNTPSLIKLTILRIASLIFSESEGNIGITSKSFGDSGTRTFFKTTNYVPYLEVISSYRIIRLQ